MKKKKNAFTLIELLAIIVILAIIAVITVPIILDIIDNSRKGAATASAYGYKDAINNYYLTKLSDNTNWNELDGTYGINSNGNLKKSEIETYNINVSGEHPTDGYIVIQNKKISGCLVYGEYSVTINNEVVTDTNKGNCKFAIQDDATTTGELTIGDIVAIGETEKFYVINSDSLKTVLLAYYNINSLYKQDQNSSLTLAFSDSQYWCDDNKCPINKYENIYNGEYYTYYIE